MNSNPLKIFVFAFFMFFAALAGVSFAQDDPNQVSDAQADQQAREEHTQQTLNDIHALELKMQENAKRLDALEKAVNQTVTETAEAPVTEAPEQAVSAQEVPVNQAPDDGVPAQRVAPVQEVPVQPINYPQAPIYFAPIDSPHKEHTFELSLEDFYSALREHGDSNAYIGHDNRKNGDFFGFNAAYSFRPLDSENLPVNVFHFDVHGDYGVEGYDFIREGKIKNVNTYIVEPRLWVGHDLDFSMYDSLTPYIGFGYRWYYDELKNKFSDAEDDDGGNNIQTQYFYIPVGAELSLRPIAGWRINLNGEYDYLVWGRITNYSSNFTVGSDNISSPEFNNTLGHGYGIRGSIKIIKEGYTFNYFVEPYVRCWNIGASKTVSATARDNNVSWTVQNQENKNHTIEAGARVGVEF